MADRKERLIEMLLEESLGKAPPDLSGRIMLSLDRSEVARVEPLAPVRRLPFDWIWAAAAAAVLVIGVALFVKFSESPEQTDNLPVLLRADGNGPALQPSPYVAPDKHIGIPPEQPPLVTPPRTPEKVEGPKADDKQPAPPVTPTDMPREEPRKDARIEDTPQPAPSQPPKPGPNPADKPKPGPDVKNLPKDPPPEKAVKREPTEAPGVAPVAVATVAWQSLTANLQYKLPGPVTYRDVTPGMDLMSGWTLRSRHPVALDLGNGVRVWFDGDLGLDKADAVPVLHVQGGKLYVDSFGCKGTVSVRHGELAIEIEDAAMLADPMGTKLKVACLYGELTWGESKLGEGQSAMLSGKGFDRERNMGARLRDDSLIRAIERAQNLWREDFDSRLGERLFAGEVEDGRAIGAMRESTVGLILAGLRLPPQRAFIRVRLKSSLKGAVGLQLLADEIKAKFHKEVALEADKWTTVKLPVTLMQESEGRANAVNVAVVLSKFQAMVKTKGAQLEIDWIEIGEEPVGK